MTPVKNQVGFSFLYFTPQVMDEHLGWLGRLAHHGYDGAELPVVDATDNQIDAMRNGLEQEGLVATAVGFATPAANPLDPDPAGRLIAIEHLARISEKAAMLGAEVLAGPMHSAYGCFTDSPPTVDEKMWCAEVLHAAGEHAAALGVKLAIEPLNRFECYFLNTAADCADLVRAVGHPNVVGTLDTHHAHIEEASMEAAIQDMGDTLGHVQLSENHRGTPGQGQVDFPAVLASLDRAGYEGWLVIEAFSRQDPDFGSALRIWRSLGGGPEEVLAAGASLFNSSR